MKRTMILVVLLAIPLAVSFAEETEKFTGTEVVPVAPPGDGTPPAKHAVSLKLGEIRLVYAYDEKVDKGERAFFVPPEGNSVVQIVIEKGWGKRAYYLKAVGRGRTVGGIVDRAWLDSSGFAPRNDPAYARIQAAVKAQPWLISVQ